MSFTLDSQPTIGTALTFDLEPVPSQVALTLQLDLDTQVEPTCESEMVIPVMYNDAIWSALYPSLQSLANYLVNTSPLPSWRGQEADVASDIVQETLKKLIERMRKAERGVATPIHSLKQMMSVVAYNHFRDLKRHDYRLLRLEPYPYVQSNFVDVDPERQILDLVTEKVYQEDLFILIAGEVERFPKKQRQALLTDLANRMSFDMQPTPLQEAFLDVGIELRLYKHDPSPDMKERSRHVSLLSQAYKRLAHLPHLQSYMREDVQEELLHQR